MVHSRPSSKEWSYSSDSDDTESFVTAPSPNPSLLNFDVSCFPEHLNVLLPSDISTLERSKHAVSETQTEHVTKQNCSQGSQTKVILSGNEFTQTKVILSENEFTQTKVILSENEFTQTKVIVSGNEFAQTEILISGNEATQTDAMNSMFVQTDINVVESISTQTFNPLLNSNEPCNSTQTESEHFVENLDSKIQTTFVDFNKIATFGTKNIATQTSTKKEVLLTENSKFSLANDSSLSSSFKVVSAESKHVQTDSLDAPSKEVLPKLISIGIQAENREDEPFQSPIKIKQKSQRSTEVQWRFTDNPSLMCRNNLNVFDVAPSFSQLVDANTQFAAESKQLLDRRRLSPSGIIGVVSVNPTISNALEGVERKALSAETTVTCDFAPSITAPMKCAAVQVTPGTTEKSSQSTTPKEASDFTQTDVQASKSIGTQCVNTTTLRDTSTDPVAISEFNDCKKVIGNAAGETRDSSTTTENNRPEIKDATTSTRFDTAQNPWLLDKYSKYTDTPAVAKVNQSCNTVSSNSQSVFVQAVPRISDAECSAMSHAVKEFGCMTSANTCSASAQTVKPQSNAVGTLCALPTEIELELRSTIESLQLQVASKDAELSQVVSKYNKTVESDALETGKCQPSNVTEQNWQQELFNMHDRFLKLQITTAIESERFMQTNSQERRLLVQKNLEVECETIESFEENKRIVSALQTQNRMLWTRFETEHRQLTEMQKRCHKLEKQVYSLQSEKALALSKLARTKQIEDVKAKCSETTVASQTSFKNILGSIRTRLEIEISALTKFNKVVLDEKLRAENNKKFKLVQNLVLNIQRALKSFSTVSSFLIEQRLSLSLNSNLLHMFETLPMISGESSVRTKRAGGNQYQFPFEFAVNLFQLCGFVGDSSKSQDSNVEIELELERQRSKRMFHRLQKLKNSAVFSSKRPTTVQSTETQVDFRNSEQSMEQIKQLNAALDAQEADLNNEKKLHAASTVQLSSICKQRDLLENENAALLSKLQSISRLFKTLVPPATLPLRVPSLESIKPASSFEAVQTCSFSGNLKEPTFVTAYTETASQFCKSGSLQVCESANVLEPRASLKLSKAPVVVNFELVANIVKQLHNSVLRLKADHAVFKSELKNDSVVISKVCRDVSQRLARSLDKAQNRNASFDDKGTQTIPFNYDSVHPLTHVASKPLQAADNISSYNQPQSPDSHQRSAISDLPADVFSSNYGESYGGGDWWSFPDQSSTNVEQLASAEIRQNFVEDKKVPFLKESKDHYCHSLQEASKDEAGQLVNLNLFDRGDLYSQAVNVKPSLRDVSIQTLNDRPRLEDVCIQTLNDRTRLEDVCIQTSNVRPRLEDVYIQTLNARPLLEDVCIQTSTTKDIEQKEVVTSSLYIKQNNQKHESSQTIPTNENTQKADIGVQVLEIKAFKIDSQTQVFQPCVVESFVQTVKFENSVETASMTEEPWDSQHSKVTEKLDSVESALSRALERQDHLIDSKKQLVSELQLQKEIAASVVLELEETASELARARELAMEYRRQLDEMAVVAFSQNTFSFSDYPQHSSPETHPIIEELDMQTLQQHYQVQLHSIQAESEYSLESTNKIIQEMQNLHGF